MYIRIFREKHTRIDSFPLFLYATGNMNELVKEKSQEISFAIIRIAAYVRRFDLRKKLENLAFHLIENVYYDNTDLVLDTLRTIDGFLDLGSNIYEIVELMKGVKS